MLMTAPGQPNRERKHHDTIGNMLAETSHVLFFYLSKVYPNKYMVVGYLLFLQEQRKDHHHQDVSYMFVSFHNDSNCLSLSPPTNSKLCFAILPDPMFAFFF
jgi:hypothetical protein